MKRGLLTIAALSLAAAHAADWTLDLTDAAVEEGPGGIRRRTEVVRAKTVNAPAVGDTLTFRLFDDVTQTLTLTGTDKMLDRAVFTTLEGGTVVYSAESGLYATFADNATRRVYSYAERDGKAVAVEVVRAVEAACCGNNAHEAAESLSATEAADVGEVTKTSRPFKSARRLSASRATTYETGLKIRLLFVFDANAMDYLNNQGKDYMSFAASAVTQMNRVLTNSRLSDYYTYELAGVTYIPATDSNINTAYSVGWGYMTGSGTNTWAGVLEERYATKADIVVALIDTGTSGGVTGLSHPYTGTTTDYAKNYAGSGFCVCSVRTAEIEVAGTFGAFPVLSHEVAHTLGCGHSDTQDFQSSAQSSAYSYGYQFAFPQGQSVPLTGYTDLNAYYGATVMAYKEHFFKNEDGTYMPLADVLALTGWTAADDRTKWWDNTSGEYGTSYGYGVFNYCQNLPYFCSPEYYLVNISSSGATVIDKSTYDGYSDEYKAMCVPMGDTEKHNNRQVLLDNYQYASRWHLGVSFSKATAGTVVNGKDDKIALAALSDGCTLYYTTDGTEPTASNGTRYTAPFSLPAAATVKARAYDSDGNAGDVLSQDYTLNPIGVAVHNTDLPWTTGGYAWYVDESGVARSAVISADGITSTLSTTITGPARLSFGYQPEIMDSDVLNVTIDGSAAWTYAGGYSESCLSSGEIAIPSGEHTVNWEFTVNFNMFSANHVNLYDVAVEYDYDPDEPEPEPDPGYEGPEPVATWVTGEFEDAASLHAGYAITRNDGNTIDGGNLVIGGDVGVTIALSGVTNVTKASVLVKYTAPSGGAPVANATLGGADTVDANGGTYFLAAIATAEGESTLTGGYINNGAATTSGFDFSATPAAPSGEGYMLLAFESDQNTSGNTTKGLAVYTGDTLANLAGGSKDKLQWRNCTVTALALGGANATPLPAWTGLVIEKVALFPNEWLSPDDIAGYTFPEPAPAVVPGTVSQEEMTQANVALDTAKEWAVVTDTPIYFTVPSNTNVFTVAFDADIPDAEGTLFGWNFVEYDGTYKAEARARRDGSGLVFGSHNGADKFAGTSFGGVAGGTMVVAAGSHSVMIEYDHRNNTAPTAYSNARRGTTITVDGAQVYHHTGLSYTNRMTTLFALGGAAKDAATDVLAGLKVRNLRFWDGLVFRDGSDASATKGVTLNGATANVAKSLSLMNLFALESVETNVTFAVAGIDATALKVTPHIAPPLATGSLSVLGKADLTDAQWTRARVYPAESIPDEIPLTGDGFDGKGHRFFQLRAEEGRPEEGTTVD